MNSTARQENSVDLILIRYFLDKVVKRIDWNQFASNSTGVLGIFGVKDLQTGLLVFVNAALVLLLITISIAIKYGRRRGGEKEATTTTPTTTFGKRKKRGTKTPPDPTITGFNLHVNLDDNNLDSGGPHKPARDYPRGGAGAIPKYTRVVKQPREWGSDEFSEADYDDVAAENIP